MKIAAPEKFSEPQNFHCSLQNILLSSHLFRADYERLGGVINGPSMNAYLRIMLDFAIWRGHSIVPSRYFALKSCWWYYCAFPEMENTEQPLEWPKSQNFSHSDNHLSFAGIRNTAQSTPSRAGTQQGERTLAVVGGGVQEAGGQGKVKKALLQIHPTRKRHPPCERLCRVSIDGPKWQAVHWQNRNALGNKQWKYDGESQVVLPPGRNRNLWTEIWSKASGKFIS